jgi:anti-repressor protein|nr:MAG TPA_asm: KilAC domain protein [Caudoviricetes sp.]
MNELTVFNNEEFGEIRTMTIEGEPWFMAADVCRALDIGNSSQAISRLDEDEKMITLISNEGNRRGNPNMTVVNEPGLYTLILSSRKPETKVFKRWVTHDILPTIRKTGGYVNDTAQFVESYFGQLDPSQKHALTMMFDESKRMSAQLKEQAPKVLFANAVETAHNSILIGDLAKIIRQNGVDIGQKRLFDWMRQNGYLIKGGQSKNMPTQKAMDMNLFEVKESTVNNPDGSVRITRTTKVTGKGQTYFVKKFLA